MPQARRSARLQERLAQVYIGAIIALGAATLVIASLNWESHDQLRFVSFFGTAVLASLLKVRLPGVTGAVSVLALFILVSIANLSLPEALVLGSAAMLVQCTWRTKRRPKPVQVAFSVCALVIAIYISAGVLGYARSHVVEPVSLGLLAVTFFVANTFPIAMVIALTEKKRVLTVWRDYRWMLSYYVVGSSMAWLVGTVPKAVQWELPIICLPLVYVVHRSNRTQIGQIEQENKHVVEMNALHLRTIEALALAIDAKDHTTHGHLQRVQLYAIEIGQDLGLSALELDALRAAAILHDIGKLAVPESIISKPGKLTRSEFEKMKIHPVVGAEILERVNFPYPVVPIVRTHHERWDGSGYPVGLKGPEIPIGARILSAVDCLDALASDRQYRRALPLEEAMARVSAEAGTSFDPDVVRALERRYVELEARAKEASAESQTPLSVDIKITRGSAPAAGFEAEAEVRRPALHPVAKARAKRPNQSADSLEGPEALAVAALRVEACVAYDTIVFFACEEGLVRPKFVAGDDRRLLGSLCVPRGDGLVGWVAETGKPILNGNPSVEPGYSREGALGSALALPLHESGRVLGVIALYRRERDAFAADELVSLLSQCEPVTAILLDMEQALQSADDASHKTLAWPA
jgi:putative nucleotidyltransferase with HDIG domain